MIRKWFPEMKSRLQDAQMISLRQSIVCDSPVDREYDRVMPLFEDESLFVCANTPSARPERVLDIGTGSGILAICALGKGAGEAIGVDLNPKAIRYAQLSAEANRLRQQCQFLVGNLYGPVEGEQFDLVLANPPFVPLPVGFQMFLSADGGPDGIAVVRGILEGINNHLREDGQFLLLTMSLGDEREPLVFRYLRPVFQKRKARIQTTHIYEKRCIEAEPYFTLFQTVPTYSEWRQFLEKERLTHLYYMLHVVEPNSHFEHVEVQNTIPFTQTEFSGSWAARLNRFQRWFEAKTQHNDAKPGDPNAGKNESNSATPPKRTRSVGQSPIAPI